MNKRKIRITEDGSTTLELIGKDENFHSTHGAIQESEHIFIKNGLLKKAQERKEISIFEMGFGTGLNALLSGLFAIKNDIQLNYFSIEAYPIELELIEMLNFSERLELSIELERQFNALHLSNWHQRIEINPNFSFEKRKIKLEDFKFPKEAFDLVYFDAFNPDLQPELWTEEIFRKIYQAMKPQGILMTYSAKGKVKRALKAAGFSLNALPGPPGKREITQAIKLVDFKT
ncbi:MAG: tRNA (5-methylaminomethyl-2-thiouridine)(34)-methyltransferase MnmD [Bacteroidales bacterium]|nr:tRNA (5-methylaminomethyl-2-thiouridine)(34)-methyltransferase MnmD [Bacteroidales bacterium]